MIIVLMGPVGAGKTTVGKALANALAWAFVDEEQQPSLAQMHEAIVSFTRHRTHAVVACAALRERHRLLIGAGIPSLRWVLLDADRELLVKRLRERPGHFAGAEILDSQLRELEPPRHELTLPAQLPVDALVDTICTELGLTPIRSRQVLG